jgi:hypothetical protein
MDCLWPAKECDELFLEYRAAIEELQRVVLELGDASISHEIDAYNLLWQKALKVNERCQKLRRLLFQRLASFPDFEG